jgi:iron(II)-dependent oxidoreductase
MRAMTVPPLASYSDQWQVLPQKIAELPATRKLTATPEGMVRIAGDPYLFRVQGIEIEGSNDVGVDLQYTWEDSPRRHHEHTLEMKTFFIDKFPVTNAQLKTFLDATKYHPADDLNFLRDWSKGTYPEGWANNLGLPGGRARVCSLGRQAPAR